MIKLVAEIQPFLHLKHLYYQVITHYYISSFVFTCDTNFGALHIRTYTLPWIYAVIAGVKWSWKVSVKKSEF